MPNNPLKTTIPGLAPINVHKNVRSSIKFSDSTPECKQPRLKTDTKETHNHGIAGQDFKVWKGKVARYRSLLKQSLNLYNKFETLGEDKEVPVSLAQDVFDSEAFQTKEEKMKKIREARKLLDKQKAAVEEARKRVQDAARNEAEEEEEEDEQEGNGGVDGGEEDGDNGETK